MHASAQVFPLDAASAGPLKDNRASYALPPCWSLSSSIKRLRTLHSTSTAASLWILLTCFQQLGLIQCLLYAVESNQIVDMLIDTHNALHRANHLNDVKVIMDNISETSKRPTHALKFLRFVSLPVGSTSGLYFSQPPQDRATVSQQPHVPRVTLFFFLLFWPQILKRCTFPRVLDQSRKNKNTGGREIWRGWKDQTSLFRNEACHTLRRVTPGVGGVYARCGRFIVL